VLDDKQRAPAGRHLRQPNALLAGCQSIILGQNAAHNSHRLHNAGTSERIFDEEAVEAIHRASRGIPRIINLICEHSLILAYVEHIRQVPAAMVHAVARDLDLDPQPFMVSATHSGFPANSTLPQEARAVREGREER
jgi:hypothetical protein